MIGQKPSCDYLNKTYLKSPFLLPFSICVHYTLHVNHNIVTIAAVHECKESDNDNLAALDSPTTQWVVIDILV
jgi:hypothetical protein